MEVRTFDSLGIDADLVKIEVEGEEFKVLAGMVKHLPQCVMVELPDERRIGPSNRHCPREQAASL